MARPLLRSFIYFTFLTSMFLSAACDLSGCIGGCEMGCAGCSDCGCDGCELEPIPGGYPSSARIENAAQVRLTSSGVDFLNDNLAPIVEEVAGDQLLFDIGEQDIPVVGTLCPGGGCFAKIDIEDVDITPSAPRSLRIDLLVNITSVDDMGARASWPVDPLIGSCSIDVDTSMGGTPGVEFVVNVDLAEITSGPRAGYSEIIIGEAVFGDNGIEGGNFDGCGASFLLTIFGGFIRESINGLVTDSEFTCQTQGTAGCPGDSVPDDAGDPDSICRKAGTDECVEILLGIENRLDLGGALASISPGSRAIIEALFAAQGDGQMVNNGASVNLYGGLESVEHNECVPEVPAPPLPTISEIAAFDGNNIPGGTDTAHVGIGISEQFMNYAGYGAYDSGLLCLGITTSFEQLISTGLFSLAIRSLGALSFPEMSAPIGISLRPQAPPDFTVGDPDMGEPLLDIILPLEVDFYVWSSERYVRFMTYAANLGIALDLEVEDGAITPVIGDITADGAEVKNAELLTEDPAMLAETITSLLSTVAGMFTGGIDPIELPDIMGIGLDLPPGGIGAVEEGGERFLGIWANLVAAGAAPLTGTVETQASVVDLALDEHAMALETWKDGALPRLVVQAQAAGPNEVEYEYAYRLNRTQWSAWQSDSRIVIDDEEALLFQGRHALEVKARVVGEHASADPTPVQLEVLVDILPPELDVNRLEAGGTLLRAFDVVTEPGILETRFRRDGGEWGAWQTLPAEGLHLEGDPDLLEVEVRDEAGNVGAYEGAIIRGRPDSSASSGCDCAVVGEPSDNVPAALLGLGVLGFFLTRRRRD